jgi:hypothetical protein
LFGFSYCVKAFAIQRKLFLYEHPRFFLLPGNLFLQPQKFEMKFILAAAVFTLSFICSAQDPSVIRMKSVTERNIKKDTPDTLLKVRKKGGSYSLNVSQGSLNNWAAGGDDFSLSINSLLNLYSFYKNEKHTWDNTLDFNFGYIKTTSLGSRKNDDRVDYFSKYGYSIGHKISLAGIFNFRSQFFRGYNYPANIKTLSSSFLSPGYITFSIGFDYKPVKSLSIFLSPISSRWIIVKNDSLSARGLYGVDSNRHVKNEIGAFATINYLKNMNKTITYRARLDLLSNYKHHPENIDVFMTNILAIKLNKLLSITWNVDVIYDDDVRLFGENNDEPALQVKSLVGIGFLLRF